MNKVLYSGSFNPFHNGHLYVYNLSCQMFGKENVWLGIGQNNIKKTQNGEHLRRSLVPITQNVIVYDGLTADVVKKHGFNLLVRGIRPGRSLEDEQDLMYWNHKLCGVNTIFIPTPPEINQISSGAIRVLDQYNQKQEIFTLMNKDVYLRWKNKEPLIPIVFGRSCCGKSTWMKKNFYRVWEFDKEFGKYLDADKDSLGKIKDLFYQKSDEFLFETHSLISSANWEGFADDMIGRKESGQGLCLDIPMLGMYWDYVPDRLKGCLDLIRFEAEFETRKLFSQKRGANPNLIECSDYFYKEMPFRDCQFEIYPEQTEVFK